MNNDQRQQIRRALPASGMVEDAIILSKCYQLDYVNFSKKLDGFDVEVKIVPEGYETQSEDEENQDD